MSSALPCSQKGISAAGSRLCTTPVPRNARSLTKADGLKTPLRGHLRVGQQEWHRVAIGPGWSADPGPL